MGCRTKAIPLLPTMPFKTMENIKILVYASNFFIPFGYNSSATPTNHRTMERSNRQPNSIRNRQPPQATTALPDYVPILEHEVQNLLEKGAICQVSFSENGFYSLEKSLGLCSLVPKKDGGMRPVRSEHLKRFYQNSSFSNGALNDSKVSSETRSLYDQIESQRSIPFGGYPPSESEISSIFYGKTKHFSFVLSHSA